MQTGFTSNTFRQVKSIEKIVEIARYAGADCIEWCGLGHVRTLEEAAHAKELCDKNGIAVSSYGSYYRAGSKNTQEWKLVCEIAAVMGAKYIRVWLGDKDSEITDEEVYVNLKEDICAMCAVASEYGIDVCPECHDNTFNNNTDAFLRLSRDVSCKNFATYFQSRYRKKEYDLDRIERTARHIRCVHISYSEQTREQFPKRDSSYINSILDKLISVGYDGDIIVEFTYPLMKKGIPYFLKKDISRLKNKMK